MDKCDSCGKYHFLIEGVDKGMRFEIHVRLPVLPDKRTMLSFGSYEDKHMSDVNVTMKPVEM